MEISLKKRLLKLKSHQIVVNLCLEKLKLNREMLQCVVEFSEKVQSKMHKCRRLVVVFTPSYMATDWCIYCFSEGM